MPVFDTYPGNPSPSAAADPSAQADRNAPAYQLPTDGAGFNAESVNKALRSIINLLARIKAKGGFLDLQGYWDAKQTFKEVVLESASLSGLATFLEGLVSNKLATFKAGLKIEGSGSEAQPNIDLPDGVAGARVCFLRKRVVGNVYLRMYAVGDNSIEMTVNARWSAGTSTWLSDDLAHHHAGLRLKAWPAPSVVAFGLAPTAEFTDAQFNALYVALNPVQGLIVATSPRDGWKEVEALDFKPMKDLSNGGGGTQAPPPTITRDGFGATVQSWVSDPGVFFGSDAVNESYCYIADISVPAGAALVGVDVLTEHTFNRPAEIDPYTRTFYLSLASVDDNATGHSAPNYAMNRKAVVVQDGKDLGWQSVSIDATHNAPYIGIVRCIIDMPHSSDGAGTLRVHAVRVHYKISGITSPV